MAYAEFSMTVGGALPCGVEAIADCLSHEHLSV